MHTYLQVKSRRQQREHQRTVLLKAQAAEKESRVAAERLVRSEQEAVKLKQKHEEALVRLEMVKIRKQLKEKQERERFVGYIFFSKYSMFLSITIIHVPCWLCQENL